MKCSRVYCICNVSPSRPADAVPAEIEGGFVVPAEEVGIDADVEGVSDNLRTAHFGG